MSQKIIRVIETRVYEYDPYDERNPGQLQDWYLEKGVTTLPEAMELDRQQAETTDDAEYVGPEEYATEKLGGRTYQFNIVTVPDDYDHTDPLTKPAWDEQEVQVQKQ